MNYETGVLFAELLKKVSQEKSEKKRKQQYLDRKQGRDEDPRKYYADKMKLWEQAHAPDKRNLVGFKNEMLRCMDNEELKDKCRFFMPEKLQHENEIKEVLERQLSHDMDGLNVTYTDSFETVENRKRADEMWETGKNTHGSK